MKSRIVIAAGLIVSACTPVVAPVIYADRPVAGAQGSSIFHDACNGNDMTRGLNMIGHTLYDTVVTVRDETGKAVIRAWAPAHYGTSVSTHIDRLPYPGRPRCGGESLKTEVLRAADGDILRWQLEMAVPEEIEGTASVVVRAETPVNTSGGKSITRFTMANHTFTAEMNVARGAYGILMDSRNAPEPKYPSRGTPLPDERYGRTLDEMRRDAQLRGQ